MARIAPMMRRLLAFCFALLAIAPALAQTPAEAPPAAPDPRVLLDTSAGPVTVTVHLARAPITAANFLRYAREKRFDGATIYRAYGAADYGFIQGGPSNEPTRILPPITHEPTTQTGLVHDDGALSMARWAPGTATGDFFIVMGRMTAMDAQPDAPGDNAGFAVFAHVTEGMDVVRAMVASPRSATRGEGAMKGQMLEEPVVIRSARILP